MSHAVIHADALTYLRGNRWLVQNGFIPKAHAIFCDPPYALPGGFMSKDWDNFKTPQAFQSWVTTWATLLLDYVYPGGMLLAFGGTRTYHRLATGLEDAGWEITDCMMWVQGQGFPKSAAIDKLLDKEAGAAREVVGEWKPTGTARLKGGIGAEPSAASNGYNTRIVQDTLPITAPATPLAARWDGYGTALKPAYEPVVVARAPRDKRTYAALTREFGTGALAIDAARIGTTDDLSGGTYGGVFGGSRNEDGSLKKAIGSGDRGRWPANFGLVCACEGDDHADDCPVSVLGRQSGVSTTPTKVTRGVNSNDSTFRLYEYTKYEVDSYGDTGTAARFFYQAKAAAWEREAGLHDRTRKIGGGKTMLRPRADLTPEKRAWLEAELERRGIA